MNKSAKLVVVSLLVCMVAISIGSVAAMNGYQNGDLDRVQLKKQLQDGSCCGTEVTVEQQQTRERLQENLQERLRDGSCSETATDNVPVQEQARKQLQEQLREQLRNGSCGETEMPKEPAQEQSQYRSQFREQFRYGVNK